MKNAYIELKIGKDQIFCVASTMLKSKIKNIFYLSSYFNSSSKRHKKSKSVSQSSGLNKNSNNDHRVLYIGSKLMYMPQKTPKN